MENTKKTSRDEMLKKALEFMEQLDALDEKVGKWAVSFYVTKAGAKKWTNVCVQIVPKGEDWPTGSCTTIFDDVYDRGESKVRELIAELNK